MQREEMHDALDSVVEAAKSQFSDSNPARLAQFESHAGTVKMCVDALYDEVPYRPLADLSEEEQAKVLEAGRKALADQQAQA